jgi:diphosphomevalonate decarboxylase
MPMTTALSTPNIAFIKYWGNRNNELRLPAASSLSMTLDSPSVTVSVEKSDVFRVDSNNKDLNEKDIWRFKKHWELTKQYLSYLDVRITNYELRITIDSQIPASIGLASSAAVFSATAKAYAAFLKEKGLKINDEKTSVIARLGSGSAARSVMSGLVALDAGLGENIDSAKAVQIANETHWALCDIVVVPDLKEKKVGSTEGHRLAHTSPLFNNRISHMHRRQQECIDSILSKDFEKLQCVTEEDCMDMHKVMMTSNPPLNYLNDETYRIIKEVEQLRKTQHIPVLYTMDAGPTVHLVCEQSAVESIKDYAHAQKDCTVFETKIGSGAKVVQRATKTHFSLLNEKT